MGAIAPSVPIYIGAAASRVPQGSELLQLQPGSNFSRTASSLTAAILSAGPFELTPYLVDHSAFDAYALHVAAAGRTLFYSGDLRAHGRKASLFERLIKRPPAVDTLLLEGTRIHERNDLERGLASERDVEEQALDVFRRASGAVLAFYSPQNLDRLVTLYRAAKRAGRLFVLDLYAAAIAAAAGRETIPQASWDGVRVFVPQSQRVRVKETREFDRVAAVRSSRIYPEQLSDLRSRLVITCRSSMLASSNAPGVSMVLKRFGRCGRATSRSHQASNSEATRAACDPADDCSRVRPCHCARISSAWLPRFDPSASCQSIPPHRRGSSSCLIAPSSTPMESGGLYERRPNAARPPLRVHARHEPRGAARAGALDRREAGPVQRVVAPEPQVLRRHLLERRRAIPSAPAGAAGPENVTDIATGATSPFSSPTSRAGAGGRSKTRLNSPSASSTTSFRRTGRQPTLALKGAGIGPRHESRPPACRRRRRADRGRGQVGDGLGYDTDAVLALVQGLTARSSSPPQQMERLEKAYPYAQFRAISVLDLFVIVVKPELAARATYQPISTRPPRRWRPSSPASRAWQRDGSRSSRHAGTASSSSDSRPRIRPNGR